MRNPPSATAREGVFVRLQPPVRTPATDAPPPAWVSLLACPGAVSPAAAAASTAPSPAAAGPISDHAVEPVVTLQRDGDRVTQITIRCRCGELIELACVY